MKSRYVTTVSTLLDAPWSSWSQNSLIIEIKTAPQVNLNLSRLEIMNPSIDLTHAWFIVEGDSSVVKFQVKSFIWRVTVEIKQTNCVWRHFSVSTNKEGGEIFGGGGGRELKMTGCSNQEWNAKKILRLPLKKISSVTPSDTIPLSHAHTLTNTHPHPLPLSFSHTHSSILSPFIFLPLSLS